MCVYYGYKPTCMHTHTSPDTVGILLVVIYVQGVFHLDTWNMTTRCTYYMYIKIQSGLKISLWVSLDHYFVRSYHYCVTVPVNTLWITDLSLSNIDVQLTELTIIIQFSNMIYDCILPFSYYSPFSTDTGHGNWPEQIFTKGDSLKYKS